MVDFVSALPNAREGVRRLSQVLSGVVVNTRSSEVRKATSQPFTSGGSFSGPSGSRMLSSDDAQLAQESVDRLAALIALGPTRHAAYSATAAGGGGGSAAADEATATAGAAAEAPSGGGLEGLPEDQAEQYLTEMYDMLLKCRVPEALGELTALASSALLGPSARPGGSSGERGGERGGASSGAHDEAAAHEEAMRRRSVDLRASLDLYVRDGGPSPARASVEGLLCNQKLGGHAQALLESICQLLLSCVFDPIWRHRDLLAQPRVRDLVIALSCSRLIPALSHICLKLRVLLARPATLEAASHAWLLGFVAKNFTGLCRCLKAMVEFDACAALWAQLGDAFAAQLAVTQFVERFSAAAAAVHPSYMTWRLPPPPGGGLASTASRGTLPGGVGVVGDAGGVTSSTAPLPQRPGEMYLELSTAVEVFLEGLFHLTWHFTARAEEAAAAGPPPPLLVRDILAAMEPEGSGSVADLLAAAAAAGSAADVRPGSLGSQKSLLGVGGFGAGGAAVAAAAAWPGLVSGPATHSLAADWLAHVVARLDGGEVLNGSQGLAPEVAAAAPLLHKPGHVDTEELPLLLSVCLAVAAAGAPTYIANGGPSAPRSAHHHLHSHTHQQYQQQYQQQQQQTSGRSGGRRSFELFFSSSAASGDGGDEGRSAAAAVSELASSVTVKHANRLLRLTARGLKAMAATQDAELAPYPAIHAAHSCAVAMHKILRNEAARGPQAGVAGVAAHATGGGGDGDGGGDVAVLNRTGSSAHLGPSSPSSSSSSAAAAATSGLSGMVFWPFVPPPPEYMVLLLDSFQAALLCYSAFLHPDPDKDPLTLRAVERCQEQLLELCTADGQDLRLGVAAVAYVAQAGLLPALEAVLRAASLTCRLDILRVLLTAVLSSVPALQQLLLSRDGYLFMTLRKLIIACINLACPHPLEYPMPAVQPPTSRQSLTLILQQCSSANASVTPTSAAANSQQYGSSPYSRGMFVPDRVAYSSTAAAVAESGSGGRRHSGDSGGGRSSGRNSINLSAGVAAFGSSSGGGGGGGGASGRPLILPLAVDLLDTVSMVARRFIEVHEGRVAAAADIRIDAFGHVMSDGDDDEYDGDEYGDGDDGSPSEHADLDEGERQGEGGGRNTARRVSAAEAAARRRRQSFEREATELLPLAQLLPFALWWLAAPTSDLVDALAQEVINDDGSGNLFGNLPAAAAAASTGAAGSQRSHHPRVSSSHPAASQSNTHPPSDNRRSSIELQPSAAAAAAGAGAGAQAGGKLEIRRRQSIDLQLRPNMLSARPVARGGVVDSLGGGGAAAASAPSSPWSSSPSAAAVAAAAAAAGVIGGGGGGGDRSWVVLSRCADALHTLFRLMVTLSDLNRRAPHPDWQKLIASLQPQQLLARAVQVLVHGLQRQRQHASETTDGRPFRSRGPAFPVLLSSLLSASVCGVQYGWLVPESFGIPSATVDPAELENLPYNPSAPSQHPPTAPPPPQPLPSQATVGGNGPVQGPLFSRVRRFTVISANPEGRAYQWAMIGDEEGTATAAADLAAAAAARSSNDSMPDGSADGYDDDDDGEEEDAAAAEGGDSDGEEVLQQQQAGGDTGFAPCNAKVGRRRCRRQRRRRRLVTLLRAAAPGGAWSSLPPPPGPAVVPTRALQVMVSDHGSAADKVLFDLLLRGLSTSQNKNSKNQNNHKQQTQLQQQQQQQQQQQRPFFWVPPSESLWRLRTCSNPSCMNLSGLHEAQLQLAACPRCGSEWYCSRHCQAMHWHTGHKAKCGRGSHRDGHGDHGGGGGGDHGGGGGGGGGGDGNGK